MGIDIKPNLQELLEKELTRKQFIQLLGVMIISIFGFNNLLAMLTKSSKAPASKATKTGRHGFGASKFGI